MSDRPEVPEWLERLRGPCPACGGQGFHVEPDHDPACDGEHCGVLGCPVPVQIQCDCQGLLFSLIAASPEFEAMREKAEALDELQAWAEVDEVNVWKNAAWTFSVIGEKNVFDDGTDVLPFTGETLPIAIQRARKEPTDD